MTEQLLNEREAAALLRLSPTTLRNWRHQGLGPEFLKLGNKSVRYRPSDLNDWLNNQ